jgi:hypothetical protein
LCHSGKSKGKTSNIVAPFVIGSKGSKRQFKAKKTATFTGKMTFNNFSTYAGNAIFLVAG